jgi:hypothetical protein
MSILVGGLMLAAFGAGSNVASAQERIHPNQHFIGLVNGSNDKPVVYTVCPGPAVAGFGPVAGNQDLSVAHVGSGGGFTGPYSQVYAWFAQDSSINGPQLVRFARYGVPQPIPSAVRVPCDGTGQVEFDPCPPLLIPCAATAVPDVVEVRFVNIAV